jgi:cbb3-type cytochrome oxidase subunit 3
MNNISATYKGLVAGILMVITCIIGYFVLKIPYNSKEQLVVFAIYTAAVIWSLIDFNKTTASQKKFKDYFQAGFKTFMVITLLMVIYCFVFYSFNTEVRDNWIANNNQLLLKEGNHMPAEIEANGKQMKKMFLPLMAGINMFKYLIIGVLITVITAGVLVSQKKN